MKKAAVAFVLAIASVLAMAQTTPAGLWKTIDDDGKTEKSTVRIVNTSGVYSAKVEKISNPAKADEKCVDCSGAAKDQPIVGLTFLWDVKQDAEESGLFDGGMILDPTNGRVYKVRLRPIEGGKKLEVRGYVGSPAFGRTQTWIRIE